LLNLVADGDEDAEEMYRDLTAQHQSKKAELETLQSGVEAHRPVTVSKNEVKRSLAELRHGLEQPEISQKRAIVQHLLAWVETGHDDDAGGRFAYIHFDTDNLLNVLGKTGIFYEWYCTMKQKSL
jgi:hypothetical protein